ncbi:Sip1-related alpha-galactosidase [Pontiella sulfatireligans]|uniref:Raffinose synthase or seed inhibition protein Sip1 n=1 Tax=Pontiella sulfatireligans TaxID=2750658 RepID=A0A6C2UM62_9BACT|nr:Sip1-related alpha-galactosidase [Pontiella sulfatireligans]VGO20394.1 hypothetical protein SCARR_02457 [Pontiella sulfatireligans]
MAMAFNSIQELSDFGPEDPENSTFKNVPGNNVDLGQFMLLKLMDGSYMALMPISTDSIMSAFFVRDGVLLLKSGHFGTERVTMDIPAMATATGATPYEATQKVWKKVMESGVVHTDWRSNKVYPEICKYMGWCSWEHYRLDINTQNMSEVVHALEANPVPFRWFMIDDGYLNHERRRLINFEPDAKKFPGGWQDVTGLKNPDGIRWMGVWRNMMGYMSGVSMRQDMDLPEGTLVENAAKQCLLPNGTQKGSDLFYEEMGSKTAEGGFDFVKVDFQARGLQLHYGMENPIRSMYQNNMALEKACKTHMDGLMNCIAQTHVNVFNTKYSALTRSSKDYSKVKFNKEITYQSFANHLWMGPVLWGDLDMFHSHGEDADALAIARAVSGSPVYILDEPSMIDASVLLPFCDRDGKIFQADAPAVLLPESYFIDPFFGDAAFRVITPTKNKVAALALFNFTGNKTVPGSISAADYPYAGEQLQPYAGPWKFPTEGLLAYEQKTHELVDLAQPHSFPMEPNSARLFMLYPKTKGWAVIGRTDKYLSSATVEVQSVTDAEITFTLREYGPFAIWSANGAPKMKGVTFSDAGNGLYMADVPVGGENVECVVRR